MAKVTARYQVKVPPILIEGDKVAKLGPIELETNTGKAVIYPPGSKEHKPKSYIEPKQGISNLEVSIERKDSHLWDADTLWVDVETEVTSPLSEKEIQAKLDVEMHQLIFRFLRLLRRKLPETPMSLPASLQHSVSLDWGSQPSGQTLAAMLIPGVIRVVSQEAGLTEKKWGELCQEMLSGADSELWEDFIEDSKVALEENDLNRATLYAAIGCEIFIKEYTEKAAKETSVSQKFWKYLKSRRPRVPDYYDQVLHLVKGHSLKTENRQMYNLLDQLYEARNRIMHEGKLSLLETKISQLTSDIREAEKVISWVRGL